jgi:hypothetical protein
MLFARTWRSTLGRSIRSRSLRFAQTTRHYSDGLGPPTFIKRFGVPLFSCFTMATTTTLILHVTWEILYNEAVRERTEKLIEDLKSQVSSLEQELAAVQMTGTVTDAGR